MEAIVISVVGGILQVVAKKVVSVSVENFNILLGYKDDMENLTNSIKIIENMLCVAEMRQVTDGAVKMWLQNLEDVAFETDYVLDKFIYRQLRRSMKSKLLLFFSASNYLPGFRCGRKIRLINLKLESVQREGQRLGLPIRLALAAADPKKSASLETDSFAADPMFLGREDDVSRIVSMLTDRSQTDKILSVIPIVGMGGSGKTTLARKLFHDGKIRSYFGERRSWVHVSQNFEVINVLKKFLSTLTSHAHTDGGVDSREAVLKKLEQALLSTVYFLVLDDFWDLDSQKWKDFMSSLSGVTSTKGNCIVVTTRNKSVASIVGQPQDTHHLEGLPDDDCWSIIKGKAFPSESVPSKLEAIGTRIARRCRGLPLAASVVGGVLRGKSEEEWLRIEKDRLSFMEGDESYINRILRLSFDNLHSPILKKCFTYCSVFPRGEDIQGEELIQLWMAEGFLQSDRGDMEFVGNTFLDHLLQSSLLHVVERDKYGNVARCGMHDLVHDLAVLLSRSSQGNNSRIRYLGIDSNLVMEESKHLRALFYRCGDVSGRKLLNFRRLHALTLTGDDLAELPSSITKLIHLRYLNISCTGITCLPSSIDDLCLLQTFRARRGKLTKLPNSFTNLSRLRHLHIDDGGVLPPDIGKIVFIQTLPHFRVSSNKGCRIGELGSLHNLKGKLRINNLEEVHGEEEAMSANLCQKQKLIKLRFGWDKTKQSAANGKYVLQGLQPPQSLKSLSIEGFQSTSFPLWTMKMAVRYEAHGTWHVLNCLIKIKLSNCNCSQVPKMGHLPNLKFLYLKGLHSVTTIGSSFYGIEGNDTFIVFPALERLTITNMTNLTEWEASHANQLSVFPCLQYLRINQCKQLKSAPSHFPSLRELDICEMASSRALANICGENLRSLTEVSIERVDGLEYLPDWFFYNNQSLTNLKIKLCTRLSKLPDGLHSLKCLRSLTLVGLSGDLNVNSVFVNFQTLHLLTKVTINI